MKKQLVTTLSQPKGYTLIELMIAITLTAILFTIGANSYFKAQKNQAIKAATENIVTILSEQQKKASSGTKDCEGLYLGQQASVQAGESDLTLVSVCKDPSGNLVLGTPTQLELAGVTFISDHTFTFRPLNQGIELSVDSLVAIDNLDYSVGDNTYRIEIARSGSIRNLGRL